jgi:FtsH-binding integral membrane protein
MELGAADNPAVADRGAMDFFKRVGAIVIGGLVALGVLAGAISWWRADPATHDWLLRIIGHCLAWMAIVLMVPWATFFIVSAVARKDSNAAGGVLVGTYTVIELALFFWLFHTSAWDATMFVILVGAGLFAAIYNLFACDFIAEKV